MRNAAMFLIFLASTSLWAQSPVYETKNDVAHQQTSKNCAFLAGETDGSPLIAGISVAFSENSSAFRPTQEQIEVLSDIISAKLVMIKGRTSTNIPSTKDEALALARAISARNWLVNLGVSPAKIFVNHLSAGDYKEDNNTKKGRAANQRVDIDAYFFYPKH